MILTYKTKHNQDFSKELVLAKKIAEFGLKEKKISSKYVKHFGLKSMISNQILRKYSRNKTIKRIRSVKLTISHQGVTVKDNKIYIPCLKLWLDINFNNNFKKINQIELDKTFAYISCTYEEPKKTDKLIGIFSPEREVVS